MEILAEKREVLDGINPEIKFPEGVGMSHELIRSRHLSGSEKFFIAGIQALEDGKRGCCASNKYLCTFFGRSESCISEKINKLAKYGIISLKYTKENNAITGRIIKVIVKDSEIDSTIAAYKKNNPNQNKKDKEFCEKLKMGSH